MSGVTLDISNELLEAIARRAAEIVSEQVDSGGDQPDGFLNAADAAEFLACPISRIHALVSARRIPHHRDGSRLLFDRTELRAYVAAGGAKRP
ncbi:MAG: helix-turn-helix domain-containing protein [Solirubrobacterales bacterium]